MKFKEIANRFTGFSCPIFGVSWNPVEAEVTKARRVISFLEDRRVLYVPSEVETPKYCVQSVLEIRRFLTEEIGNLSFDAELSKNLRGMRAACRKFLNTVENDDRDIVIFANRQGHYANWIFIGALGEMRGVFGMHIAKIAIEYGIDVEDDLASILPEGDDNGEI
ncbi:MAG TPA: DUF6650 family protein [Nitrososphaera sp.]|nr:DUF6650 family protein [Nitrososphaera sp.]